MKYGWADGSTSFTALVAGILLLSLGLAVVPTIWRTTRTSDFLQGESIEARLRLVEALERVMQSIDEDPTPETDSLDDRVWSDIGQYAAESRLVGLQDISSRVNPNSIHPKYVSSDAFSFLLRRPFSAQEIIDFRESAGYSRNLLHFEPIFAVDMAAEFLTTYSNLNVNIDGPEAIRDMVEQRSEDPGLANEIQNRIEAKYAELARFSENEWVSYLRLAEGQSRESSLFPLLSTIAIWNIHQVPERLLRALCEYPFLELPALGQSFADKILSLREGSAIGPERLSAIVEAHTTTETQAQIVLSFLGTKTWYYRFSAFESENAGLGLEAVIAVVPLGQNRFKTVLVEHRFLPTPFDQEPDDGQYSAKQ